MYKVSRLLAMVSIVCITVGASAAKPKISLLYADGWKGFSANQQNRTLGETIVSQLVITKKFDIVEREKLEAILSEQKLQFTGVIAESTAAEIGKILGVDFFVVAVYTHQNSEYVPPEYKNGVQSKKGFYSASVGVTARTLDVATASYVHAYTITKTSTGASAEEAFSNCIANLAKGFANLLAKEYPLIVPVQAMLEKDIQIGFGASAGIRDGQHFALLEMPFREGLSKADVDKLTPVDFIYISSINETECRGTLLKNPNRKVENGWTLLEWNDDVEVSAKISKIQGNKLVINVGSKSGIRSGATFSIAGSQKQIVDDETGEVLGEEKGHLTNVVVTKPMPKYSYAKVFEGSRNVEVGQILEKSDVATARFGLTGGFGLAFTEIEPADSFVEAGTIEALKHVALGIYMRDLKNNLTVGGELDVYIREQLLGGGALFLNVGYDFYLIPAKLFITPGAGIGLGILSQEPPNNVVADVFGGNGDRVDTWTLYAEGFLKMQLQIKNVGVFIKGRGQFLHGSSWEYTYDTYGDETESETIDEEYLQYPDVFLGPLGVSAGISVEIF